jgi:hypothetical protein
MAVRVGRKLVCLTAQRGRTGDLQTQSMRRHQCG